MHGNLLSLDNRLTSGTVDSCASSTYSVDEGLGIFNITYLDTSQVIGNYSNDTLTISDAVLPNFTFGLAQIIQVSPEQGANGAQYGIMGVSYNNDETSTCGNVLPAGAPCFAIDTVPDALYRAGIIGSRSYSIYVDGVGEGAILFGGVDTARFAGPLATLAVQPDVYADVLNGTYISQDLLLVGRISEARVILIAR